MTPTPEQAQAAERWFSENQEGLQVGGQLLQAVVRYREHFDSLAALLAEREAAVVEKCAKVADAHRDRAKAMQAGLLQKRDPVYGVGSADSKQWDQFQHGAGAAAAIATAIRALRPEPGEREER